ncbi:uncharacterized protein C5L36_0C06040 [Pichia kudriavzevii]|uniref:Golgi apparatus membrane protein TVP18 n=1 Tax=Pichia kudriavzevii TaxID=4909 RepID=A0A1V2LQN9_PICKU|nr:uncharacterized protein C5L36_0C06040 [Pichia kudriavzevii]AWU76679.1 hypothetical protein C5L36_0C06040 [Pichia kudriavzevii]ONH76052.1 Golgi apparatus membrane protein TVP18 [Pichia kudriavzevii]
MAITDYFRISGFVADMKSRNLSLYGQWIGITSIFLSLALGISNLFHVNIVFVFGIIAIVQAPILALVEIPFLLKIFRIPDSIITFVQSLDTNFMRVIFYAIMAIIQWLSLTCKATSLIALAIMFTIAMFAYAGAMLLGQEFHKSNVVATVQVGETPAEAQIRNVL